MVTAVALDVAVAVASIYLVLAAGYEVVTFTRLGFKAWSQRPEWWFEDGARVACCVLIVLFGVSRGLPLLVIAAAVPLALYVVSQGLLGVLRLLTGPRE